MYLLEGFQTSSDVNGELLETVAWLVLFVLGSKILICDLCLTGDFLSLLGRLCPNCGLNLPSPKLRGQHYETRKPQKPWIFRFLRWVFSSLASQFAQFKLFQINNWLGGSTHLKNSSQNGHLPQLGVKIKHLWHHHLDNFFIYSDAIRILRIFNSKLHALFLLNPDLTLAIYMKKNSVFLDVFLRCPGLRSPRSRLHLEQLHLEFDSFVDKIPESGKRVCHEGKKGYSQAFLLRSPTVNFM